MYSMMFSGKYWFLDLWDYLLQLGFRPSKKYSVYSLKRTVTVQESSYLIMSMICYISEPMINDIRVKHFEELLQQWFNLVLLGQAQWYLVTCINQLNNFDIELDKSW
jgi:hypothetical protein